MVSVYPPASAHMKQRNVNQPQKAGPRATAERIPLSCESHHKPRRYTMIIYIANAANQILTKSLSAAAGKNHKFLFVGGVAIGIGFASRSALPSLAARR